MKAVWSPQLESLLASFESLSRLLIEEPSGLRALEERLLAALAPEPLGLSLRAVDIGDWELLCGGVLYAADCLGKAHELFQNSDSFEGAYWHGMLHRREGDFSNALYWIRRAGRVPALGGMAGFSPTSFIAECEAAAARREEPPRLLETQRREWEALMFWSWRRLAALC
jgi:hypothetical protein